MSTRGHLVRRRAHGALRQFVEKTKLAEYKSFTSKALFIAIAFFAGCSRPGPPEVVDAGWRAPNVVQPARDAVLATAPPPAPPSTLESLTRQWTDFDADARLPAVDTAAVPRVLRFAQARLAALVARLSPAGPHPRPGSPSTVRVLPVERAVIILIDRMHTVLYPNSSDKVLPDLLLPTPFSASGAFSGPALDRGDCETSTLGRSPVDTLRGAVVLCRVPKALRGVPARAVPDGGASLDRARVFLALAERAAALKRAGAAAVLFWDESVATHTDGEPLRSPPGEGGAGGAAPSDDVGLPAAFVRPAVARELAKAKHGAVRIVRGQVALRRVPRTIYALRATLGDGCGSSSGITLRVQYQPTAQGHPVSAQGEKEAVPGPDAGTGALRSFTELAAVLLRAEEALDQAARSGTPGCVRVVIVPGSVWRGP